MVKVLLVEDDTNLREIFAMRLQAEGYQTLSAGDGEEGLVMAMKEKPDLMIVDVMMPKLSGFEMLETLRATPEMGDIKVIMMTALGQAEDRTRGEKLGVVKYLVKSQVTLEDFVRVVREVLQPGGQAQGQQGTPGDEKAQPTTNAQESEKTMQDDNVANNPMPGGGGTPPANPMGGDSSLPPAGGQMSSADEQATVQGQINDFAGSAPAGDSSAPAMPPAGDSPMPTPPADAPGQPPADPAPDSNPMPGAPPAPPAA